MTTDGADRSFGAPRFDVVLRGYDRRQVDEHLSRLQRVVSRMRGDLDAARAQSVLPAPPAVLPTGPPTTAWTPPGVRPRPTPRPRPDVPAGRDAPDVVGTFTDRMQTILQAAEEEAAEIRAKARSAVRAEEQKLSTMRASVRTEEEMARVTLANLLRQRDAVLADLTRVRGQLEALLSGPTARIPVPTQSGPAAAAARQDAGAGHPLPGTPTPPVSDAAPEPAPDAAPDAEAASAGPVVTAAEQTLELAPAEDAVRGNAASPAEDQGETAAAPVDAGPDAEGPAAVSPEAESPDAESPDAESPDAESPDAESPDAESPAADPPVAARPAEDDTGAAAGPTEDDRDPTNPERDAVSNSR